jgi:hypothetical protein
MSEPNEQVAKEIKTQNAKLHALRDIASGLDPGQWLGIGEPDDEDDGEPETEDDSFAEWSSMICEVSNVVLTTLRECLVPGALYEYAPLKWQSTELLTPAIPIVYVGTVDRPNEVGPGGWGLVFVFVTPNGNSWRIGWCSEVAAEEDLMEDTDMFLFSDNNLVFQGFDESLKRIL